ncbi:MAG: hypothetical protein M0P71_00335 [Melioribacteraceae bacterium]|nr:hypothetical protein [Melioribacteraceae bacterium]
MKQAKRNNILLFICLFILLSCSGIKDEDYKNYAKFYVDKTVLMEIYNHDSIKLNSSLDSLYSATKINPDQFNKFILSLKENKEKWNNFYKEVDEYLESQIQKQK